MGLRVLPPESSAAATSGPLARRLSLSPQEVGRIARRLSLVALVSATLWGLELVMRAGDASW